MRLGADRPQLPALGLGCMSMSWPGHDDKASIRTVHAALDAGITLLDTADRYGDGHNERLLGRALAGRRPEAVLATKVGFGRSGQDRPVDGTPRHLHAAARAGLQRLSVDAVDLLYLHRVDPLVPVEESVGALAELVEAGLVRHVGLSEVSAETLRRACSVHPIAAVQGEYSLWSRGPEAELLPACRSLGVAFVAYSPLGKGFLAGAVRSAADIPAGSRLATLPRVQAGNLEQNLHLVHSIGRLAAGLGCTPAQLALGWLIAQDVVAIPGSAQLEHLLENAGAREVRLSPQHLAALDRAAPVGVAVGARRPPTGTGSPAR